MTKLYSLKYWFWFLNSLRSIKFKIWPFSIYFCDFWPLVTSIDLEINLFWKDSFRSFILRYILSTIEKDWNLNYIKNLWPHMTSVDLATTFFGKLTSRASFWYIINFISWKLKVFEIFDIWWPRMTLPPLFWKADVKSVILTYNSSTFNELQNLTLNESKFVIWPWTKIFSVEID